MGLTCLELVQPTSGVRLPRPQMHVSLGLHALSQAYQDHPSAAPLSPRAGLAAPLCDLPALLLGSPVRHPGRDPGVCADSPALSGQTQTAGTGLFSPQEGAAGLRGPGGVKVPEAAAPDSAVLRCFGVTVRLANGCKSPAINHRLSHYTRGGWGQGRAHRLCTPLTSVGLGWGLLRGRATLAELPSLTCLQDIQARPFSVPPSPGVRGAGAGPAAGQRSALPRGGGPPRGHTHPGPGRYVGQDEVGCSHPQLLPLFPPPRLLPQDPQAPSSAPGSRRLGISEWRLVGAGCLHAAGGAVLSLCS